MVNSFVLNPGHLTLNALQQAIENQQECILDESCFTKINQAAQFVEAVIQEEKIVYGINTGFGALASEIISASDLSQLQRNIVLSHACGTGELLSDEVVALILLLKINNLAQGYSGVRGVLIQALLALYNAQVYPCIPSKGSVGASGDLAPLAHLALPLLGVGMVRHQGKVISALDGLAIAKLQPLQLAPKEGLALLNGLQVCTALCIFAYFQTKKLFDVGVMVGSMSVDAAKASRVPFDARIHQVRRHGAQIDVASLYRDYLASSDIALSHQHCTKVQDPYSLRCQPQIMGAVLHQMRFVEQTLEVEANAISDNPLIFVEEEDVLSGGNFHGQIIGFAADNLALAVAEIGANSERRIALLIDKQFSGHPPFLVQESGLNSGFMVAHVTAASCASENKALAHPHSVDSIPTSANQEDHVSMAASGARRLLSMIDNTASILAIELLAASQGLTLQLPLQTSPKLQQIFAHVRHFVEPYDKDRYFAPDIEAMKTEILSGAFTNLFKVSESV